MSNLRAAYLDDTDVFPLNKIIASVFLILLSCVFIPCALLSFGMNEVPLHFLLPTYALLCGGIAFLFTVVRRPLYAVFISVILFFLYSYTQSPTIPAFILAILLSFSLCGFVSSVCGKKAYWLIPLLFAVSYVGAYALCGDFVFSCFSILPLPSAVLMGILQKRRAERTTIISSAAAVFLLLLCGIGALYLYTDGNLSLGYITRLIESAKSSISEFMKTLTLELDGASAQVFEAEMVDEFVTTTFNLLPGYIVSLVLVILYLVHTLQLTLYKQLDFDLILTEKSSKISVSIYGAALFAIAYIFSLSTDSVGTPDLVSAIFGNLFLMLTPGLFAVGFEAFGLILKKSRRFALFIFALAVVVIFILSQFIIQIVAAIGAIYIIITTIDKWAQKHYSKKEF